MTNFCKMYNKVMNRLKDKHKSVSSVNVVTGLFQIIGVLFVTVSIYLLSLVDKLYNYTKDHVLSLKPDIEWDTKVIFLSGFVSLGVILYAMIFIGIVIDNIVAWIILFPFMYATFILVLGCIIGLLFDEEKANKVCNTLLISQLDYIVNKTTSYCDLKNK